MKDMATVLMLIIFGSFCGGVLSLLATAHLIVCVGS